MLKDFVSPTLTHSTIRRLIDKALSQTAMIGGHGLFRRIEVDDLRAVIEIACVTVKPELQHKAESFNLHQLAVCTGSWAPQDQVSLVWYVRPEVNFEVDKCDVPIHALPSFLMELQRTYSIPLALEAVHSYLEFFGDLA